jgi:hypothetical protein
MLDQQEGFNSSRNMPKLFKPASCMHAFDVDVAVVVMMTFVYG